MTRALTCVLFLLLGLSTARVHAQTTDSREGTGEAAVGQATMRQAELSDSQARSHFRVGETLYAEGRFADAAREFEQAYVLSRRPALLYNAFVAYRDANDLAHAIVMLDEYLRVAPEADDTPVLRSRLAAMRATRESQMTEQSSIDAERARLEAERAELAREAEEARVRAENAERQVARTRSPLPFVVGGAGLAILAGSGVAAIIAGNNISSAEDTCPDHICPRDANVDLGSVRDSVRRPALASDVMLAVGGATLVSGIVWLVVSRSGTDDQGPTVSAACDGRGCTASYSLRF